MAEDGGRTRGTGVRFFLHWTFRGIELGEIEKVMMTPAALSEKSATIQTAGQIFPGGVALELLRDPTDPKHLRVLTWQGKILEQGLQVSHDGLQYEAVQVDPSIANAMRFPSSVAPPETTGTLFDALHGLFTRFLKQSEPTSTILGVAALASWLPDLLPIAPVFYVVAPTEGPKIVLLQLLRLVCRRGLLLVGVKPGDFRSLPMELLPTLLLDEPDMRPAMQQLILSSSYRGTFIPCGRGLLNPFGPKIIFSRAFPRSLSLASPVLRIVLTPTATPITPLDEESEERIATEFQSRLLAFRLRYFKHVRVPEFEVSNFTSSIQILAKTLGAAFVGEKELQENILEYLSVEDQRIRAERSSTVEALVIEALLFFCHDRGVSQVRSSELARKVSAIFAGRGSDEVISAESAGWKMKGLGLLTGTIDNTGNGIKLTDGTRRLVHELAVAYDILTRPGGFHAGCAYCDELKKVFAD
jgi:hypothetical protein